MRRRPITRAALAITILGAITVTAGAAQGQAAPVTSGTIHALSYNVAGLPAVLSGSEPHINTQYISPLLNDYDLVLVQEDWANPDPPITGLEVFHEVLISQVTHPYLSEPAVNPIGTNPLRPTAILSDGLNRMSRYRFEGHERHMWPTCFGGADTSDGGAADCLAEKGFSLARTELAPGVEVDVYNLHAEAGSTAADQASRANDFEVLAEFINTHSAGRAVIVGGDFNLHTDRPIDGEVFSTFLAAADVQFVCDVVDCGTDYHVIDKFVFRSGGGITLEPTYHRFERAKFVRPTDGAPLSDHSPLAVDFAWSVDQPVEPSLSGTVTGPGGQPEAGVTVWAYAPGDSWVGSGITTTAADGTYRIDDLAPGRYAIAFVPVSGSGLATTWYDGTPGRDVANPQLLTVMGPTQADEVLSAGATVSGVVTAAAGAPVAGATVWTFRPTDTWVGSGLAVTGADGSWSIERLPTGTYSVLVVPPAGSGLPSAWYGGPSRGAATKLDLPAGTSTGIDLAL